MKTLKKQIKVITFLLTFVILFQGCTVYKSTPITLELAVKKEQKVKVITTSNEKLKFKRIGVDYGQYYGIIKKKGEVIRWPLNSKKVNTVRLKDKTLSTVLTIALPLGIIIGGLLIFNNNCCSFGGGFGNIYPL